MELEGALVMLRAQKRRDRKETRAPFCTMATLNTQYGCIKVVSWGLGCSFQ